MRRLFLVGLSWIALGCGDDQPDSASAEGTGTGGATSAASSSGTPSATTSGATPSTSGMGPGSSTEDPSGSTSTDTSSGEVGTSADGETEGSDESGPALPRGQWAITEITYAGGGNSETLSLQDRAFCDATVGPESVLLRYQQADGFTVWTVTIPTSATVGTLPLTQDFSGAYMNINEVGETWQTYFDPSMAFGSLELTEASLQPSGVVAGVLSATLTSANGTTAEFSSTFYAELP